MKDFNYSSLDDGTIKITKYVVSANIDIPSVINGKNVTTIDDIAFEGCYTLESITIPNSVTTIGDDAFFNCASLKSATIPDSVTKIGHTAFGNCESLESVTIPYSVTTIGNYAFGYYWSIDNRRRKVKKFHIYCYKDTAGEKYTVDNRFNYTLLD